MNSFQNDLMNLRQKIIDALRSELMGPGSEISYPDAEHELISEYPSDRYSVGILYPQNVKFGDNDAVKEEKDDKEQEETESGSEDIEESGKHYTKYKDCVL